jgi:ribosome-associated toxin RatA of RatAB toxin-antitoxin module
MQTLDRDARSALLPAPPDVLWRLVADVSRTPEMSPEVSACRWIKGATGPAVGARFEATNTVNGRSWKNRPVVTACEPGAVFAFERTEPMAGTVAWRWAFTPADGGTWTTVSYEVTRPITRLGWFVIEHVFRGGDRRTALAAGMEQSLRRLGELAGQEQPRTAAG